MEKRVFYMVHDQARQNAVQAVQSAPAGYRVEVKEPSRSLDQNAKFHAICSDVSKSGFEWMGKPRSQEDWKVLFVSGHAIATKQGAEIVPGIEGEFVNIRESTARMSKERGSSLIEYCLAFCSSNNIVIGDSYAHC